MYKKNDQRPGQISLIFREILNRNRKMQQQKMLQLP